MVLNHKIGCQAARADEPFMLFPMFGRGYVWTAQSRMPVFNRETRQGGSSMILWATVLWYSVGASISVYGRITAEEYMYRLVGQSSASQDPNVISEQTCSFQRLQCPDSHSWNCSVI
jgi:hypothetical protein